MSDVRATLLATAERLFTDQGPGDDGWNAAVEAGFPLLLVGEGRGGFGAGWGDLMAIARLAGFHAFSVPLADMIAAGGLLPESAAPQGTGVVSTSPVPAFHGRFTGRLQGLPWGRRADYAVVWNSQSVHAIALASAAVYRGSNAAGEPCDDLDLSDAEAWQVAPGLHPLLIGAAIRTAQIAGALARVVELTIEHATTREQFGRPIARFQAVQQNIAILAGEAAACDAAARSAADYLDHRQDGVLEECPLEIAAAKLRACEAAVAANAIAHQIHGAVGFTAEHPLHRYTARLIAWRSEFGTQRYWASRLGEKVLALGSSGLWQELTSRKIWVEAASLPNSTSAQAELARSASRSGG